MMDNRKWIESLLDDMVESQWTKDIIKQEYERLNKSGENDGIKSIEDLEPISQYSKKELNDCEFQQNDFNVQLDNFSRSDYEDYLISQAVDTIGENEYFEEIEFSDDYLENLIRQHLDEEEDFLDMVMKEAIAEDGYFQEYIEQHFYEENLRDYPEPDFYFDNNEEVYYYECPEEKEVFDDLGDTSYMDQGIYKGANTDSFEEPFEYSYYEEPFSDDDLYYEGQINDSELDEEIYRQSQDFIDVGDFPDDLILEEPDDDNVEGLVKERLFEEKYLDRIFVEIIKRDKYWDRIIKEKLARDEKFREKIAKFS